MRTISKIIMILFMVTIIGCADKSMTTRTYKLPDGDTSWEAITMVLEEEWHEDSITSKAKRRGDSAVVRTTTRGHRKIADALETR